MPNTETLAPNHGQNSPLGLPLRSDSAITLMPLISTELENNEPLSVVGVKSSTLMPGHSPVTQVGGPVAAPPGSAATTMVADGRVRRSRRRGSCPGSRRGRLVAGLRAVGAARTGARAATR